MRVLLSLLLGPGRRVSNGCNPFSDHLDLLLGCILIGAVWRSQGEHLEFSLAVVSQIMRIRLNLLM